MDATGALCATHPDRPADATCDRCGLFTCEKCRKWYGGRPLCLRCHAAAVKEKPSPRATAALVLATAGFCGFVLGLPALILAYQELAAIRSGQAPASGEGWAILARNLGWFHMLMLVACAVAIVARWG